jgi:hypothetical protein
MIDHNEVKQTPETRGKAPSGDSDGDGVPVIEDTQEPVPVSMEGSANNTIPAVDAHRLSDPVGFSLSQVCLVTCGNPICIMELIHLSGQNIER